MKTIKADRSQAPVVIFELVGSDAGQSVRLAGFEFHRGELQVPRANLVEVEKALRGYSVRRKLLTPRKLKK